MKYLVTYGSVYHDGANYEKGSTVELTESQARRLENVEPVAPSKGKPGPKPKDPKPDHDPNNPGKPEDEVP